MRLPLLSLPPIYAVMWAPLMFEGRCGTVPHVADPAPVAEEAVSVQEPARPPERTELPLGEAEVVRAAGDFRIERETDFGDLACGGLTPPYDGPPLPPRTVVPVAGPSALTGGDEDRLVKTVKQYTGQLHYCYEQALRLDRDLVGTLDATWQWEDGRAFAVSVVHVGTPEIAELSDCVTKKIRRWESAPDVKGEVSWTFRFELRP